MTDVPTPSPVAPERIATLPKVELHVHLEGTVKAETAIELARRHGEDPAAVLPLEGGNYPHRFRDFEHFVELYLAVSAQIREPEDLRLIAAAFARQQADQGVRYSEATFTANTHVRNGMDPAAMWRAVIDGLSEVPETKVALIIDAVRDMGPQHADETIRLVAEADDEVPIVALGLAGIETSLPAHEFTALRRAADDLGLGVVVHAGETGPPEEVVAALDVLGADRIGHGISSVRDPQVLDRVVRDRVVLEVCPTSNVVIGVVDGLDDHPFPRLWEAGAQVTINSDDPPFFATTLTEELEHAVRMASLGEADLALLQRRAIDAAFIAPDERAALHREIDAWAAGA